MTIKAFRRTLDILKNWLADGAMNVKVHLVGGQTLELRGKDFLEYNEYEDNEDKDWGCNEGNRIAILDLPSIIAIEILDDDDVHLSHKDMEGKTLDELVAEINTPVPAKYEPDSRTLYEIEKQAILSALRECNNNVRKTARLLAISERTLHRRLNEYGR